MEPRAHRGGRVAKLSVEQEKVLVNLVAEAGQPHKKDAVEWGKVKQVGTPQ